MKLSTRISLFFLVALAIVLAGFSGSIYWLVRSHLYSQFDGRSAAALETLTAAIESGPRGLEWEVSERNINLGLVDTTPLVWSVFDEHGVRVDGSADDGALFEHATKTSSDMQQVKQDTVWTGELWRVFRHDVQAAPSQVVTGAPATSSDESGAKRYPALTLEVASPLSRVLSQLRTLSFTLVGLSLSIWVGAALAGKWICQKALAPLTQISDTISKISVADLNARLSPTTSGDELEELTLAFNGLLDRLQMSFERQRRFAADASHQLRTPLTALQGQVEVALRRDRTSEEYLKTLLSVETQTANLRKIVEMLLVLTREPMGAGDPEFESFELNAWLDQHIASWRSHPRIGDLRVDSGSSDQLWVKAHTGLLGQVVDNLWDNACKFSTPKSPITIRTTRSAGDVKLMVEDVGLGIAAHEVARVADPFYRSEEARTRGIAGTGLGLAIAKRILGALNARLDIESVIGRGSIFTIVFRPTAR